MAKRRDYIEYGVGDLVISNGDFSIGDSDEQHIKDTIVSFAGWWKDNVSDGVGIDSFVKSTGQEQVVGRLVKIHLENDGYTVNNPIININNEKLEINPNAELQ